jgi:hypothetical protein
MDWNQFPGTINSPDLSFDVLTYGSAWAPLATESEADNRQRSRRSLIWLHSRLNSMGEIDGDLIRRGYWLCAYCDKTYKIVSGTSKPMRHLEKQHQISK